MRSKISLVVLFLLILTSWVNFLHAQVTQTFSFSGNIQNFTVPPCVTSLSIQVRGAEGGINPSSTYTPGMGAYIFAVVCVTPGQALKIMVGEHPPTGEGGGGGSFVTTLANSPIVVAGGGGGGSFAYDLAFKHGQITTAGGTGAYTGGAGGTAGNGGNAGTMGNGFGGGGGGLLTAGQDGNQVGAGGDSFVAGGAGGLFASFGSGPPGGYGGGGGGGFAGGGGGGYSGGGGGGYSAVGGGGGSFNIGTLITALSGVNMGHGSVIISYASNPCAVAAAVSSTCLPTGTATVNIPNFNYSWTGSAQTTSAVTGLAPGVHTVTISDPYSCKAPATATVNIISTLSLTALGGSCTPANSATAFATGGTTPYTYAWSGTAQTTSVVTGLPTGSYTVTVATPGACQTRTAAVNVTASSSIAVTNTVLCIGYSTTMTATTPMASYSWSPIANILNPTNSPTVSANPTITTIYTVSATNSVGCVSSNTLQLFVVNTQTVPVINPTTCVNSTLQLIANTTYTGAGYAWAGPAGYTSAAQNPTRFPATLAMSGPYSITVISAPGCTSTAVANVIVYPIPANPTITSNAPLCSGQTLNLVGGGGTSYFWQGPGTFTSNLQNISITNATNTIHSGIYTLSARFGTGCSNTITANILVRALPVATITSNSPVCLGKNLNLSGSGGLLYTWTGPNAFASAVQNPTVLNVTAAAAGNYSMTTTDGFGCQGSTIHTVTVLNNPTVTATGTTVCFGYQAVLTATGSGASQFTWYGPASYSSTVQNTTVNPVNNPAVGTYTVILGSALSTCTAQATVNLANIPIPIMTATGTSVCSGQQAVLLSNGATTFTWTGPSIPATAVQNLTINPVTNTLTETYTVIGTAANSCTAATTATLQARINPTATAIGTTVCQFAAATLTANGGVNYSWTGPNAYTSNQQNPNFASVANTTIDTYTVLVTAANSCTDVTTATLSTKPNPTVTATGATVCLLLPAALQASTTTGIAGMTYTWTGPNTYTASGPTASIPSATSAIQQIFVVIGTAPNTCTHTATTTLNTIPLPTVVATSSIICYNYPFTINATGAIGYTWTGPSIPTTSITQNFFIPNVDGTTIGTYTVVGTSAQSCTNLATAQISTMALPSISATGTTVCFGQPATLKANGGILSGYTWSGPNAYTSNQANAFISSANNLSAGIYTVIGTGPNTCTNVNITTLSFYNLPLPVITSPPRVCMNSPAIFNSAGGTTYTWTGPYYFVSTAPTFTLPIYNVLQEGTYTLGTLDNNGCYNDTTVILKIDPSPDGILVSDNANQCIPYCALFSLRTAGDAPAVTGFDWEINKTAHFTGATFNYCVGKIENSVIGSFTNALGCTAKLALSNGMKGFPVPKADFDFLPFNPTESVDQVNFKDLSTGEKLDRWNWYLSNNKGYTSTSQHPSYVFENAGIYPVAMIVTNNYGCTDTIVKIITVDADYNLYVPNAFTPNGDGVNDIFQPKGRGIDKYHLAIYDRWGTLVYQTDDFAKGWDGSEKGKQLTDDVYTWRINAVDVNGKIKEQTGFVTVVR